jgi:hypothetical protein
VGRGYRCRLRRRYIEVKLVAHLVAEVDRLRDRVARQEDILAEQRRIMGERQPALFPDD